MATTTLKITSTPLYSLRSIIITLLLMMIIPHRPCSFASTERLSQPKSFQLSTESFNSHIDNAIHVAQEARLQYAQLAADVEHSVQSLSMTLNDCVDLLDDSIHHLYSIRKSTQHKAQGATGNCSPTCSHKTNACSSMSAILANKDMCMEGLDRHFTYISNNDMENNDEPALHAAINKLDPLLSLLVSTITAKTNDSSAQVPNSVFDVPQDESPCLGHLDKNNDKLVATVSKPVSVAINVTVALDGSGNYTSIMEAIKAAPIYSKQKFVIHVKKGLYHERVEIPENKTNLVMIGDGIGSTVITGSRSTACCGLSIKLTATFAINGCGFMAQDITFENTAGPTGKQAVALVSNADHLVFYRCAFKGYQDTLYAKYGIQFFRECEIYGTVDFICGDAKAVFQNCQIIARKPMIRQFNAVTAQQRKVECSRTGYSFHQCTFKADEYLSAPSSIPTQTYLGRPWGEHSQVVVMKSELGSLIDQHGWKHWKRDTKDDKPYYGEYENTGAGSDVKGRVTWSGVHSKMSCHEANKFTVRNFIYGDKWLPSFGVPYDLDL